MRTGIVLAGLLLFAAPSVWAQFSPQSVKVVKDVSWANLKWTGNSASYIAAQKSVENAFKNTHDPKALLKHYQTEAQKQQTSPVAQFQWGVAALETLPRLKPNDVTINITHGVIGGMNYAPNPRVHEYDRVRFLIKASSGNLNDMVDLAERLYAKNPNDERVRRGRISALYGSKRKDALDMALSEAKRQVKVFPDRSDSYATLAGAYMMRWMKKEQAEDKDNAIVYYKIYLSKMDKSDLDREFIQSRIAVLEKEK